MHSLLRRALDHARRIRNARRLGIPFYRRAAFKMPSVIWLSGRPVPLSYPGESGVRADFFTCIVDDEYGLWRVATEAATVADIGANVGFFAVAARARYPRALVHAYEPNPRIAGFLEANAREAGVHVFREAVGSRRGCVTIEERGDSNQARTRESPQQDAAIPQSALQDVVERLGGWIDLLKLDCEGAEWDMFTDASPWRHIGDVRMEYHLWGKHGFEEVESSLEHLGFRIVEHHPSGEWGTVWAKNARPVQR